MTYDVLGVTSNFTQLQLQLQLRDASIHSRLGLKRYKNYKIAYD